MTRALTRAMTPADHAFVSALSAIETDHFGGHANAEMLIRVASEAEALIAPGLPEIEPLRLAFHEWLDCSRGHAQARADTGNARVRAHFRLCRALSAFHLWRCGQASEAMRASARERRETTS